MRQFTIAERLTVALVLPLVCMLLALFVTSLVPFFDEGNRVYSEMFIGLAIVAIAAVAIVLTARSIVRPMAQVADTLDSIAYTELDSATPLQPTRGELARLVAAADRLAEVIGERQRLELVHNDLDRTWQARVESGCRTSRSKLNPRPRLASADRRGRYDAATKIRRHAQGAGDGWRRLRRDRARGRGVTSDQ